MIKKFKLNFKRRKKMSLKNAGILLLLIFILSVPVQAADILSLEEALKIAEDENLKLKMAEIEYQKAEINQKNMELQNKYNFTEINKLEINKNYLSAEKRYQDSRANIIKSIIQQYTNLWLTEKQIEAQELKTEAEKRLYNEMEARYELSQISRLDLLDQSNTYNQAQNDLENLRDNYQQSLLEFKTALNLNQKEFEIEELSAPESWVITEREAVKQGMENSNAIKIATIDFELAEKEFNKNMINASAAEQKIAELNQKSAELSLQETKENLENSIIKAHLKLKQAEKNIDLSRDNLERAEAQFNQVKRQFELGSVTKTTVLQYQASLANSEYQLKNSYLNYYLAKEELADLLNMEPGVTINAVK
jgi:hypothetical protein